MSNEILAVQDGQHVEGFDSFVAASSQWCTPSVLGCKLCISAAASGRNVILTITLQTPFGNFSKSFSVSNNICFSFSPIGNVKADLCVSDFKISGSQICCTVGASVCIKVPFLGWKCTPKLSKQLCLPLPMANSIEMLASGSIDESQFATLLLLHSSFEAEEETPKKCNCH